jgi:hypothetical protein
MLQEPGINPGVGGVKVKKFPAPEWDVHQVPGNYDTFFMTNDDK